MSDINNSRDKGHWLIVEAGFCLVIILLALVLGLSRYRNGIDFWDEGFVAHAAQRVMTGEMPNRDFVSPRPPLSFYIVAVMFKLFGTSLLTLRILGLCLYVTMPVLIYILTRHLAGRAMSFAAALPVLAIGQTTAVFAPYPSYQGLLATLLGAILVMRMADTGRAAWAIAAGIVTALVFLLRQDQGGYLMIAVFAYLLALRLAKCQTPPQVRPFRLLLFWLAGLAAVLLPLLYYWYQQSAMPAMYEQLVLFPLTVYKTTYAYPMPVIDFNQPLKQNLLTVPFYLSPVVCGIIVLWLLTLLLRRRFNIHHARLTFFVVLALSSYCYVLIRSDIYHLVITGPPFFILCGWLLQVISNQMGNIFGKLFSLNLRGGRYSFVSPAVVLLACALLAAWYLYSEKDLYFWQLQNPNRLLTLKRGGVYVPNNLADWIENTVAQLQKYSEPDQAILCLPYDPMLYFLSERRNPTSWSFIYPGDPPPDKHLDFIRQLDKDPPVVIVVEANNQMEDYAPIITHYIAAEYKVIDIVDDCVFLLPRKGKQH